MAKARSPEYPAIGLREAIEKVKLVYDEDYTNPLPREIIAKHMGYAGISGASLTTLSSLAKYGLLIGRAAETRVSPLALQIIAHPPGSPERIEALKKAASLPELFAAIEERWPNGRSSDAAIRAWLLTQGFIPPAADTAIRTYRETKKLVEEESKGYDSGSEPAEQSAMQPTLNVEDMIPKPMPQLRPVEPIAEVVPPAKGTRKEVITLDEGDVVIVFPENLSADSFGDLKDHLDLFIKKMQRRAGTQ